MKIDSKYLDIDISPEYAAIDGKTILNKYDVEFWDDGDIVIEKETTDGFVNLWFNVETLEEIVNSYKLYKTRRDIYLASIK
jgi:hypothetical protein